MTRDSSQTVRRLVKALLLGAAMSCPGQASHAQNLVDIAAYFEQAQGARGSGLAHKTKPVDVRPATPGEVIVTMINQEKETQSPPAQTGDIVVRNRCPETGHEQILVSAASFSRRYEGPIGAADAKGWLPYRPRGVRMRFVVVAEQDGMFAFTAPWGERMVAHPGDAIVQDHDNPKDTYRIAKDVFTCTYQILRDPER